MAVLGTIRLVAASGWPPDRSWVRIAACRRWALRNVARGWAITIADFVVVSTTAAAANKETEHTDIFLGAISDCAIRESEALVMVVIAIRLVGLATHGACLCLPSTVAVTILTISA